MSDPGRSHGKWGIAEGKGQVHHAESAWVWSLFRGYWEGMERESMGDMGGREREKNRGTEREREGRGEKGKGVRDKKLPLQKDSRKRKRERAQGRLASVGRQIEREKLGVGGACLLNGQGTQVIG